MTARKRRKRMIGWKLLAENMEREAALWRDGGFIGAANAYEDSSTRIREILKGDAVEEQAGYGKDKPKCPLSNDVNGVYDCGEEKCAWWTGTECAVVAIAKRGRGVDVTIKPPAVPGL